MMGQSQCLGIPWFAIAHPDQPEETKGNSGSLCTDLP